MKEVKKELKGDITEEQLAKLKKEISESLSRDRHKLLVEEPFIGNIAMRFDLIPVRDRRCLTACTDFRSIYFNCDFYLGLTPEERVFVLGHELWHNLQCHSMRKQSRDHELWNIASDMEINNILSDCGGRGLSAPRNLMFPPRGMKGKNAETLYDWLLRQQEKNNLNNALSKMGSPDNDEGDDEGQSGTGGSGGGRQKQKQKQKQNSGSQDGSGQGAERPDTSKDGKNTGKLQGQFDKHEYEDDSGDDEQDGKGKGKAKGPCDRWGEMGYDDDFRPSIPKDAAERMREAAISAAQSYQREHGNLPAGVEGLLDKFQKPEINWREYLCSFVSSIPNGKSTWLPPNRRHIHNDMYFQSRRTEAVRICVCIDTSGSCIGDLPKFFGELKGLIETYPAYELDVIQADAAVDKVDHYDASNPIPFEYGETIETCGGGGTDYGPAFDYIDENLNPDCVLYFGDGYASMSYKGPPKYPVMFFITKDGNFDFCDWGKKVRFTESSWE